MGCGSVRNTWLAKTDDESRHLAQQARQAEDRGDSRGAEYLLTAAVKKNPRDCETRLELSELLLHHGSLDAAATQLQRLAAENPDDPRSHLRLAQVRYFQQRYVDAERAINAALELDPSHTDGLLLRGKLQELRKRDAEALATYYRALSTDPDQVEAQLRIAELHLRGGHAQQAAPLLRTVLESPRSCAVQKASANWSLGMAYAAENRWDDAALALELGSHGREMDARDWHQIAYARYRSGDWEGANVALAESLQLSPQEESALALRASMLESTAPPENPRSETAVQQANGRRE